jgi:hypothetical protein
VQLLLPPSAQGLVDLNNGKQFVQFGLCKRQFGGKGIRVIRQHLQVACDAASVPHVGKPRCILRGLGQQFLLNTDSLDFRCAISASETSRNTP